MMRRSVHRITLVDQDATIASALQVHRWVLPRTAHIVRAVVTLTATSGLCGFEKADKKAKVGVSESHEPGDFP